MNVGRFTVTPASLLLSLLDIIIVLYLVYLPIFNPEVLSSTLLIVMLVVILASALIFLENEQIPNSVQSIFNGVSGLLGGSSAASQPHPNFDDAYEGMIAIAEDESSDLADLFHRIRQEGDEEDEMDALLNIVEAGIEYQSSTDIDQLLQLIAQELGRQEFLKKTNGAKIPVKTSDKNRLIVEANASELPHIGVPFDVYANVTDEQNGEYERYPAVVALAECTEHLGPDEYAIEIQRWRRNIGDDANGVKGRIMGKNPKIRVHDEKRRPNDWRDSDHLEGTFRLLKTFSEKYEH